MIQGTAFSLLDPTTWFAGKGPAFLAALVTLLLTYVAVGIARRWAEHAMRRARVDADTRILVRRIIAVSLVVFGVVTSLGMLGVEPAAILAVLGAVGLAFSLAMQDILKSFFSGIYLLLERPFRVGDRIKVKDWQGMVEHVGVRTTTLRTPENVQVLVPNSLVFAEVVSNHTREVASEKPRTPDESSATPESSPAELAAAAQVATAQGLAGSAAQPGARATTPAPPGG